MKTTITGIPKITELNTIEDCLFSIEKAEFECLGGYLENIQSYIKIKELLKLQKQENIEMFEMLKKIDRGFATNISLSEILFESRELIKKNTK